MREQASELLGCLRRFGEEADGSITRLVYTPAWNAAMTELERRFRALGLEVWVNAVGSRFGRLRGWDSRVILTGSHMDSVRQGGAYDGALGVVMAACAVGWLAERCGRPTLTLEVFANCEEESSRFPGNFWGTRALLGTISPGEVDQLVDEHGTTIGQAMRESGLDPARIPEAARSDLAAFVEPHIEQGPVLEAAGASIGIVDRVVGVRQLHVRFVGETGHAGTVPVARRRDALIGAAELVLAARQLTVQVGTPAVVTVGRLLVTPGGANQIPGIASLSLDLRHTDEVVLERMESSLRDTAGAIAARHSLEVTTERQLDQPPIECHPTIRRLLEDTATELGYTWMRLASGAGHDAQHIATRCPSGLLFVPSKNGWSHRPEEETELDHIVAGIEVLAGTLYRLAYDSAWLAA
jgi:allantoate deiminase